MTNICTFCLKISNASKYVDETLKETIELVFINVELVIAECSLICMECIQRLQLAFDLKAANICNEDLIVSYETNKHRHEKLIDFYLKKNKIEPDVFPYALKICRFCITVVTESNYLLEDTDINMNIKETVRKHLPEVDLTITNNPIVCKICLKKLQDYGMFINSWLDVYNLKKRYCSYNNKTDNPDLIEVRKFIFGTYRGPQRSDNYEIYSKNIKNENIEMFEIGEEGNAKNSQCFVDNIQLKDDIEILESKLEYPAEGEQIKTETVCSDVQLRNVDLTMDNDFEIEESKLKTEILQFETNMESDDYFLKDQDIAVSDVMDIVDSTEVEKYFERNSGTRSLCNNKRIGPQKSNEFSLSEHEVHIEISNDSQVDSSFFGKSFPKMEKNRRSLMNKSIGPLIASRHSPYHQLIKINEGFKRGLYPFQNQLEAQVNENSHYSNLLTCRLYCDYITSHEEENLKNHLKKHSNELLFYKCDHCDYKTKSKKILKSHLIVHSDENEFYKCEHCDFKSKYKYSLQTHLMVHSKRNVFYKCALCNYKTIYKCNLKQHLIVHSDENVFHKCENCDYKTKYKKCLRVHLIAHSDDKVFHKCEHCDFKTKYRENLKKHLMVHSDERVLYKCAHCNFKAKVKKTLKKHLSVHSYKEAFYKCEHCDFKTIHKSSLRTHLIGHSDETVFYKYAHCDYKTKYKTDLKKHVITHSDEIVFHKCEHCDFKTKYKYSLTQHLLTIHSDGNVCYKCVHCNFKTKYKRSLECHLKVHFNENVLYRCEHCDFKTKYKYNLTKHLMTIHSDGNVCYKCVHCNFKTKYKRSLECHLKVHFNENVLYRCEHCDFKTKYKNILKKHLMVHSSQ